MTISGERKRFQSRTEQKSQTSGECVNDGRVWEVCTRFTWCVNVQHYWKHLWERRRGSDHVRVNEIKTRFMNTVVSHTRKTITHIVDNSLRKGTWMRSTRLDSTYVSLSCIRFECRCEWLREERSMRVWEPTFYSDIIKESRNRTMRWDL